MFYLGAIKTVKPKLSNYSCLIFIPTLILILFTFILLPLLFFLMFLNFFLLPLLLNALYQSQYICFQDLERKMKHWKIFFSTFWWLLPKSFLYFLEFSRKKSLNFFATFHTNCWIHRAANFCVTYNHDRSISISTLGTFFR